MEDKIVITTIGIIGCIFIYWFFLGKRGKVVIANKSIDITVEGGYSPEKIIIPLNKTTTINFIRKDPTECLEEVVLPDFKIKKSLPLNKKVEIKITPKQKGEFGYSCAMNMYHGKIIVK